MHNINDISISTSKKYKYYLFINKIYEKYLKEISINSNKSYFDTNTTDHQHFFDEDTSELIDCSEKEIDSVKVKNNITGKKIKSVEVLIRVASDNQSQN